MNCSIFQVSDMLGASFVSNFFGEMGDTELGLKRCHFSSNLGVSKKSSKNPWTKDGFLLVGNHLECMILNFEIAWLEKPAWDKWTCIPWSFDLAPYYFQISHHREIKFESLIYFEHLGRASKRRLFEHHQVPWTWIRWVGEFLFTFLPR